MGAELAAQVVRTDNIRPYSDADFLWKRALSRANGPPRSLVVRELSHATNSCSIRCDV